jgi:hypothetical protein
MGTPPGKMRYNGLSSRTLLARISFAKKKRFLADEMSGSNKTAGHSYTNTIFG